MKGYTDLEQSKKLAEILPLKSADMCYIQDLLADGKYGEYKPYIGDLIPAYGQDKIRCWSLAALLSILPKKYYPIKDHETNLILGKPKDKWCVLYWDTTGMQDGEQTLEDNPIDACYEMILKLHELNLL